MIALLAFLVAPADAASFGTSQLPYTTDFDFTWTTAGGDPLVSSTTAFTFDTATRYESGNACRNIEGCMDGTFYTGNGGTGTFSTRVVVQPVGSCTVTAGPNPGPLGSTYYSVQCSLTQTVDLEYDTTTAQYSGSSACGQMTATAWYFGSTFLFYTGRVYTVTPGAISGTLAHPSGAIGTFSE